MTKKKDKIRIDVGKVGYALRETNSYKLNSYVGL